MEQEQILRQREEELRRLEERSREQADLLDQARNREIKNTANKKALTWMRSSDLDSHTDSSGNDGISKANTLDNFLNFGLGNDKRQQSFDMKGKKAVHTDTDSDHSDVPKSPKTGNKGVSTTPIRRETLIHSDDSDVPKSPKKSIKIIIAPRDSDDSDVPKSPKKSKKSIASRGESRRTRGHKDANETDDSHASEEKKEKKSDRKSKSSRRDRGNREKKKRGKKSTREGSDSDNTDSSRQKKKKDKKVKPAE